jgi:hypothetical protein
VDLVGQLSICLLCYERDHRHCHRKIVADRIESVVGSRPRHLGVQACEPIGEFSRRVRDTREGAPA